jgi:hypothetical protein
MGWPAIVQYWRSFDHLEAFANDASDPHVAAWRNYWKRVGTSPRTGIWHAAGGVRSQGWVAGAGRSGWSDVVAAGARLRSRAALCSSRRSVRWCGL